MLGDMRYNQKFGNERTDAILFCEQASQAAKERLGQAPDTALVHLAGDGYVAALEALGLKTLKAPWVLPHHVFFIREEIPA